MNRPSKIAVLYNTDYDAELKQTGVDVSSVEESARSIKAALVDNGYQAELRGMHGTDVFETLPKLRAADLVFNLCESMEGDARNEPTLAGLLDLFGIAYTGADLLGLASCLHKQRTKDILIARAISTPPYRYYTTVESLDSVQAIEAPYFLKLAHEDASVGITEANL